MREVMPISMKEEQCAGCAEREVCGMPGMGCTTYWDVGAVDVSMDFKNGNFTASCNILGTEYKQHGETWDDAVQWLGVQLKGKRYTGRLRITASTKTAKENKPRYYYRTSGIPGDGYKLLITPHSSFRDRSRALND